MKLPNAYTAAITDYMRKPKVEIAQYGHDTLTYTVSKPGFALQQVVAITTDTTVEPPVVKKKNEKWLIRYKPQNGKTPSLVLTITDGLERITTSIWTNGLVSNRNTAASYKHWFDRIANTV